MKLSISVARWAWLALILVAGVVVAQDDDREAALLSDREKQVLSLIAKGKTNSEIAEELVITTNTARNHVSRILDKLGFSRRSEAATFAALHGLVDDGEDQ